MTRSSNTITDVLPEVTLNLLASGTSRVEVARDTAATSTKVKALVDGLNSFLAAIATQTKNGSNGAAGGPLAGSSSARALVQQVFSVGTAARGTAGVPSLSALGIQVSRDGRYTLDEAALGKAMSGDPDGVAAMLSTFASSLVTYAKDTTASDGPLKAAQTAAGDAAKTKQGQIDALDLRLVTVQRRYTAQYAKLDATIGMLNSQSSRLSSQLSGLGLS